MSNINFCTHVRYYYDDGLVFKATIPFNEYQLVISTQLRLGYDISQQYYEGSIEVAQFLRILVRCRHYPPRYDKRILPYQIDIEHQTE